jgi:cobalt-zinc-cadmium efflux system protein
MAHAHCHGHGHQHSIPEARLRWAMGLTLAFVAVEALAGYFASSLALLSDAAHNFADAAALGLSWYAMRVAGRPATSGMTFGFHRVGILAALINSVTLALMALGILYEAASRLQSPGEVEGGLMIGVALLAIVINVVVSFWLAGNSHDLNLRSAYWHMVGDALSAAGVVLAGIVVEVTGRSIIDPIVSIVIAVLIFGSCWGILRESVLVLLEGTPAGLDMQAVERCIKAVPGVHDAHDLHVWMIGTGVIACSCHIVVAEQTISSGQQVLRAVVGALHDSFQINHTTVQIEVQGCDPNHLYCNVEPLRPHEPH